MGRVLVTGGTGFVGYPVVTALASRGLLLRCVVRTGSATRLPDLSSDDQVVESDNLFSNSREWWSKTCRDIDIVLHLAWYAEPGEYLSSARNLDCLTGTIELARGAAQAGVRRFVGIGTCFEYDLSRGYLSAESPLAPANTYAATKASAYLTLNNWLPSQNVEFLWARLFYLFGARENTKRLVPYLHAQLSAGLPAELTNGTQIRDYLDVADAANMIVGDALGAKQGAINICSGSSVTIRRLAEGIAAHYGRPDLLKFGARADDPADPACVVGVRNDKEAGSK